MAKFTDNMSGKEKLGLVFGLLILALLALVFIPTETGTLMTYLADQLQSVLQLMSGGGE